MYVNVPVYQVAPKLQALLLMFRQNVIFVFLEYVVEIHQKAQDLKELNMTIRLIVDTEIY